MEQKTIIIADDHQLFAEGIFSMLNETEYKVIGYASDGFALINLLKAYLPDLVLLDINMPRMNGLDSAKTIKQNFPGVKIILLTMYEEPEFQNLAKKYELDGYLLKNIQREDLISAIDKVLGDEKVFPKIEKPSHTSSADKANNILSANLLSAREKEVLSYIARQFTMAEIARELNLSQHTVETYRKNLLRKLNQRNIAGLAVFAANNNLL